MFKTRLQRPRSIRLSVMPLFLPLNSIVILCLLARNNYTIQR